jgi:hypothetical protein
MSDVTKGDLHETKAVMGCCGEKGETTREQSGFEEEE